MKFRNATHDELGKIYLRGYIFTKLETLIHHFGQPTRVSFGGGVFKLEWLIVFANGTPARVYRISPIVQRIENCWTVYGTSDDALHLVANELGVSAQPKEKSRFPTRSLGTIRTDYDTIVQEFGKHLQAKGRPELCLLWFIDYDDGKFVEIFSGTVYHIPIGECHWAVYGHDLESLIRVANALNASYVIDEEFEQQDLADDISDDAPF